MTDTNTTTTSEAVPVAAKEPQVPVTTIERNGVSLVFYETAFKRGQAKKDGLKYPYPQDIETTEDEKGNKVAAKVSLSDLIAYLTPEITLDIITAKFALYCQGWFGEASSSDKDGNILPGTLNVDEFAKYAQSFSARGDKLSDLYAKQQELILAIPSLTGTELKDTMDKIVSLGKDIDAKKRKND